MKYSVVVTFSIEGMHCWPEAEKFFPEVSFLASPHRHMFGFKCYSEVTHTDRDVEFILLKRKLIDFLKTKFATNDILNFGSLSCESIAQFLLENIPELYKVEVWEDWENGAVVER